MSKKVHEILLEIRKKHKLSRKKLSDLSGFKEPTIVSYEKGLRKASEKYIRFISLYFNVSEDYIKGVNNKNQDYLIGKRILLMYQDIYSYSDDGMMEIFYDKDFDWVEIMKEFYYKRSPNTFEIVKIAEILNIKPSSFDLSRHSEEIKKFFVKEVQIQEEKGILLNKEYYAQMIKNRNLAKDNYTPVVEPKKLDEKYQDILDLFPYASDKFLDDIHKKLKALKEIQTL